MRKLMLALICSAFMACGAGQSFVKSFWPLAAVPMAQEAIKTIAKKRCLGVMSRYEDWRKY